MTLDRAALDELLARARARACSFLEEQPARLLVVSVTQQRLYLLAGDERVADYPVSTAVAGVGGADGSLCTPPGTHRIHQSIGRGEPPGRVFESRQPTDRIWQGEADESDLILSRILTLDGCEPGVNRGAGRDSLSRYIYIHGTNHEDQLGKPASHGCIRLANQDVIRLCEQVVEGDRVVIV